jgi:nucleotide-binding universal stress UspA family protein
LEHGLELAKALGAKVLLVYVTLPWTAAEIGDVTLSLPPENFERMTSDDAQRILADAAMAAKAAGVAFDTLHVKDHLPAQGIIDAAHERGADLIVMASHGRSGFARLLFGSDAGDVLSKSTVPVLICR